MSPVSACSSLGDRLCNDLELAGTAVFPGRCIDASFSHMDPWTHGVRGCLSRYRRLSNMPSPPSVETSRYNQMQQAPQPPSLTPTEPLLIVRFVPSHSSTTMNCTIQARRGTNAILQTPPTEHVHKKSGTLGQRYSRPARGGGFLGISNVELAS